MIPDISICISTSKRPQLLKECLNSIVLQDFPKNQLSILIPIEEKELPQTKKQVQNINLSIQWIPLKKTNSSLNRNTGIENASGSLLYFLDDDCSLQTASHLKNFVAYHERHPEISVIGGRYSDGENITSWGRAYNLVCNSWQDRHYQHFQTTANTCFVGGNLSLKLNKETKMFRFGKIVDFGAEETHYINELQKNGFHCLLVNGLNVNHNAQHDMKTFFSRAWLHGQNKYHTSRESIGDVFADRKFLTNRHSALSSKSLAALYISCAQLSYLRESQRNQKTKFNHKIFETEHN